MVKLRNLRKTLYSLPVLAGLAFYSGCTPSYPYSELSPETKTSVKSLEAELSREDIAPEIKLKNHLELAKIAYKNERYFDSAYHYNSVLEYSPKNEQADIGIKVVKTRLAENRSQYKNPEREAEKLYQQANSYTNNTKEGVRWQMAFSKRSIEICPSKSKAHAIIGAGASYLQEMNDDARAIERDRHIKRIIGTCILLCDEKDDTTSLKEKYHFSKENEKWIKEKFPNHKGEIIIPLSLIEQLKLNLETA